MIKRLKSWWLQDIDTSEGTQTDTLTSSYDLH